VSRFVAGHAGRLRGGGLLMCLNAAVSSRNDVHKLRGEGLSIRQIAAKLSMSRTKVHRWLTSPPEWDDGGDGGPFDGDEEALVPPFRFVGLETEPGSGKPVKGGERYMDATGKPFDGLALYRFVTHRVNQGRESHEWGRRIDADLDRQMAESGLAMLDRGDGYWYWIRRDQVTADMELIGDGDWRGGRDSSAIPRYRRR
jgi:hypothetical protein